MAMVLKIRITFYSILFYTLWPAFFNLLAVRIDGDGS